MFRIMTAAISRRFQISFWRTYQVKCREWALTVISQDHSGIFISLLSIFVSDVNAEASYASLSVTMATLHFLYLTKYVFNVPAAKNSGF